MLIPTQNSAEDAEINYDALRLPWQADHTWKLIFPDGDALLTPGRSVEEAAARASYKLSDFVGYEDMGLATTNQVSVGSWEPWFAWHPVRLNAGNGARVWLRVIERRRYHCNHDSVYVWHYRLRSP